jgi:hypothetical protein
VLKALGELVERRPYAVALFFALALLVVPYRTLLGPGVPSGRDLVPYFYPLKAHLVEAVRAGEMPWIDRFRGGGLSLLSSPGAGAFDPGNSLFLFLPMAVAAKAWMLARVLTGAAGFAVFLRLAGLPPLSSALGALAWGACGVTASSASFLSTSSAHAVLPWLAAGLLHVRSTRSPRSVALLGVATALLLAASVPEPVVAAALLALVLLAGRGEGSPARERLGTVGLWAWAAALGALLAAPALGALLVTGVESIRSVGGALLPGFAEQGALAPIRLAELLVDGAVADWTRVSRAEGVPSYPYFPSLTPGRLAWTLALLGLLAGRGGRARASALAVAGVLLALGPATPVFGLLLHAAPFASSLRYPEKYVVLFAFGVAWLAALGAAALEGALGGRKRWAAFALLAALLLADRDAVTSRLLPMAPAGLLERRPTVLAHLPGDAGQLGTPPRIFVVTAFHMPAGATPPAPGSTGPWMAEWALPASPGLFGVATVYERDYDVSLPRAQLEWTVFLETSPSASPMPEALARAAGVVAVVEAGPGPGGAPVPRLRPLPEPVPPFRFVRRVVAVKDPGERATRFLREGVPVDAAFVEGGAARAEEPSPARVLGVSDRPSRLELEVEVAGPGPAYLLVSRPLVATRDATLDGRAVEVDDANLGFTGLAVPPGRHIVRLQPRRTWLIMAAVSSVLGLALTVGGLRWRRGGSRPLR